MNEENVTVIISVPPQNADDTDRAAKQQGSPNLLPVTDPNALDSDTNTSDNDTMPCRICLSCDTTAHAMISPCLCKGSIANVHASCLEQWLSQKGNNRCDLCSFEFHVYSTLKYTMLQSMVIWIKHPRNRAFFIYDTAVFLILNILTGVVISMFVRNLNAVMNMDIAEYGITMWFLASGVAAVIFWLIVYCLAVSLFVNAQVRPWYQWWRGSRSIRLVINAWKYLSNALCFYWWNSCNGKNKKKKLNHSQPQKKTSPSNSCMKKKTNFRKYPCSSHFIAQRSLTAYTKHHRVSKTRSIVDKQDEKTNYSFMFVSELSEWVSVGGAHKSTRTERNANKKKKSSVKR